MTDLEVSHVNVGPLDVNCYIIGDPKSRKALVIDPGGNSDVILNVLKEKNFELESIYLTHAYVLIKIVIIVILKFLMIY